MFACLFMIGCVIKRFKVDLEKEDPDVRTVGDLVRFVEKHIVKK